MADFSKKVGRNEPCPCGSQKKFKKCCIEFWYDLPKMHAQANMEFEVKRQLRRHKYGDIRPLVHTEYQGKKVVAEGSRVYFLENCKTVPDFLSDYVKIQFGKKWWLEEVKKPESERHPIIQMAFDVYESQKNLLYENGELLAVPATGPNMAHLTFAYDLFVLRDNASFQKKLLKRLRFKDQFYGARYEMFVAASFVKGGFEVFYEDESDPSKKHPEFFAKHKVTGELIAVEAKKRHRKKLGNEDNIKLEIDHLVKKALDKEADKPLAIFIDMGLPPIEGNPFDKPWAMELMQLFQNDFMKTDDGKERFNLAVFTNYPTEYHHDSVPHFNYIFTVSKSPKNPLHNPKLLEDIIFGVSIFDKIPSSFDD